MMTCCSPSVIPLIPLILFTIVLVTLENKASAFTSVDSSYRNSCCDKGSFIECSNLSYVPKLPADTKNLHIIDSELIGLRRGSFIEVPLLNSLKISGSVISYIEAGAFEALSHLKNLELVENDLQLLDYCIFEGLEELRSVVLDKNLIKLNVTAPNDLATGDKREPCFCLDFSNCTELDSEITLEDLEECVHLEIGSDGTVSEEERCSVNSTLPELLQLTMNGNPLKHLPEEVFSLLEFSPVFKLELGDCQLESIDRGTFRVFRKLTSLNLQKNPDLSQESLIEALASLPEDKDLTFMLNFGWNRLITIPASILQVISTKRKLTELALNHNSIHSIRKSDFPTCEYLTILDLSDNGIDNIEPGSFDTLPVLIWLKINGNRISLISPSSKWLPSTVSTLEFERNHEYTKGVLKIEPGGFEGLQLRQLKLSNSRLGTVKQDAFKGLNISRLDLNGCRIESLESISNLDSLAYLDLSSNEFDFIHNETFKNLPSLIFLNLANNRISSSAAIHPFGNMVSLKTLDLSNNIIQTLSSHIFSDLPVLREINLNKNRLQAWNEPVFSDLSSLRKLYLRMNYLTELTDATLYDLSVIARRSMLKPLESVEIDIGKNYLNCSCDVYRFITTYNRINDTETIIITDGICSNVTEEKACPKVNSPESQLPDGGVGEIFYITLSICAIVGVVSVLIFMISTFKKRRRSLTKWPWQRSRECSFDAFVCYSSADRDWVFEELVAKLEKMSETPYCLCIHERDFVVGETIQNNIQLAIEKSQRIIFVISESFLLSSWCCHEMEVVLRNLNTIGFNKDDLMMVLMETIETLEATFTKVHGAEIPHSFKLLSKECRVVNCTEKSLDKFNRIITRFLDR